MQYLVSTQILERVCHGYFMTGMVPHAVLADLVPKAAVAMPGHLHLLPAVLVGALRLEEG